MSLANFCKFAESEFGWIIAKEPTQNDYFYAYEKQIGWFKIPIKAVIDLSHAIAELEKLRTK